MMFHLQLEPYQWAFAILAALVTGMSKTGIPGLGILVVNLLVFTQKEGWSANGVMLPLLIFGDLFAVVYYKRHADWRMVFRLVPWVLGGLLVGAVALISFGLNEKKDLLTPFIGVLILVMLGLSLSEKKIGAWLAGKSQSGVAATGIAAGFTTTISNAAGPIMSIFLTAQRFPKDRFMGTIAWYFFLINLTKVPLYFLVGACAGRAIITPKTLALDLMLFPAILVGVFVGFWVYPRLSQKLFTGSILVLAAIGGAYLVIDNGIKLLRH